MLLRTIFLFLLLFVTTNSAFSSGTDSLENLLKKQIPDTQRVTVLCKLADVACQSDPDKGMVYAKEALTLAEKFGDPRSLCNAWHFLGLAQDYLNMLKEALASYTKAKDMAIQLGDKVMIAREYNGIGNIYLTQGNYKVAHDNLVQSRKLYNEAGSDQVFIPTINIGNIYYFQKNMDKALEFYEEALPTLRATDRKFYLAVLISNIAVICLEKSEYKKSLNYLHEALKIQILIGDSIGMASTLTNMSNTFGKMDKNDSMMYYSDKAIALCKMTDNNKDLSTLYNNLGDHYISANQPENARYYFLLSKHLSDSLGLSETLLYNYKGLAWTYKLSGDYVNAYKFMEMFANLRDTLFTAENQAQMEEMNAKYESDKKDLEIAGLEKDQLLNDEKLAKERNFRYMLTAIIALAVILAVAFIFAFISKRKDNRVLAAQKTQIEEAKHIIEEKNKDITDSINYASRIQSAILPDLEMIRRSLPESFVFFQPKDIVSGDFYWFCEKDEYVYIAVVDCTGHGVPGSLMSMVGSNHLDQVMAETELRNTHEILNELHKRVLLTLNKDIEKRDSKDGMDVAMIRIDHQKCQLQFSGAVRPLFYFNGTEFRTTKGDKYSIAGVKDLDSPYSVYDIAFKKGDVVYLSSDGYADQFGGPEGKKLKVANFVKFISGIQHLNMQEQGKKVKSSFLEWKGSYEQVDDVCVIGVRL